MPKFIHSLQNSDLSTVKFKWCHLKKSQTHQTTFICVVYRSIHFNLKFSSVNRSIYSNNWARNYHPLYLVSGWKRTFGEEERRIVNNFGKIKKSIKKIIKRLSPFWSLISHIYYICNDIANKWLKFPTNHNDLLHAEVGLNHVIQVI